MSKTFTDEEVQAQIALAVAEATKELSKELDDFKASQTASEVEAKIAAVQAEADGKVTDLQAQLDAAVLEAAEATKAKDAIEVWLNEEKEKAELEAVIAARTEERVKMVTEAVTFPDDYVAAQTARWASMSDEDFAATLEDYKAVAEKASASGRSGLPAKTGLLVARDENNGGTKSAMKELAELRRNGFDPRELVR